MIKAHAADWKSSPMPEARATVRLDRGFGDEEMAYVERLTDLGALVLDETVVATI